VAPGDLITFDLDRATLARSGRRKGREKRFLWPPGAFRRVPPAPTGACPRTLVLRRMQDRWELAGPGRAARPGRSGGTAPGAHRSGHRRDLLVPRRQRRRPVRGGADAAEGFRMLAARRAGSLDLEPRRGRADPGPHRCAAHLRPRRRRRRLAEI